MHCIAALAVLKQFWCRVIKRLRITLLCPWCYYILWWLSSIKIYKIGGSETLKQWLSSIRIITFWKTDDFAGESRRGQDLFCHAACSCLYEPPTSPQHGTAGTIQCDLPDRRGRAGRYGKTPAFGSRRRP